VCFDSFSIHASLVVSHASADVSVRWSLVFELFGRCTDANLFLRIPFAFTPKWMDRLLLRYVRDSRGKNCPSEKKNFTVAKIELRCVRVGVSGHPRMERKETCLIRSQESRGSRQIPPKSPAGFTDRHGFSRGRFSSSSPILLVKKLNRLQNQKWRLSPWTFIILS
jgi:hypothetical protein